MTELYETFYLLADGILADYNVGVPKNVAWAEVIDTLAETLANRAISELRSNQGMKLEFAHNGLYVVKDADRLSIEEETDSPGKFIVTLNSNVMGGLGYYGE